MVTAGKARAVGSAALIIGRNSFLKCAAAEAVRRRAVTQTEAVGEIAGTAEAERRCDIGDLAVGTVKKQTVRGLCERI